MKQDRPVRLGIILLFLATAALAWILQSPPGAEIPERADGPTNAELMKRAGLEVESETISYGDGFSGYLARPKAEASFPGVVTIHEWWGLNEEIRDAARSLAAEGYIVLAVDLYDGKVAAAPDEARALTSGLDQKRATAHLRAAASELRRRNAPRIASLGWCFGGGQSLQLALSGEELDATVIYYGALTSDESQLRKIRWPVLGIFGDQDRVIPVSSVESFDASLDRLGISNEIHMYPGVGHAFANPSGANYAPSETMDAWEKTLSFLKIHLKE